MLRDIFKFNKHAVRVAEDRSLTIGEFLKVLGTGQYFKDYYLSASVRRDLVNADGKDHGFSGLRPD